MDRPSLWARFIKHKRKQTRSLKELNESAPVMQEVLELVQNTQLPEGEKFTIIDLCSGFGFMSMFLAEMLPAEKVDRIVLVDKMWPMRNQVLRPFPHKSFERSEEFASKGIFSSDEARRVVFNHPPKHVARSFRGFESPGRRQRTILYPAPLAALCAPAPCCATARPPRATRIPTRDQLACMTATRV